MDEEPGLGRQDVNHEVVSPQIATQFSYWIHSSNEHLDYILLDAPHLFTVDQGLKDKEEPSEEKNSVSRTYYTYSTGRLSGSSGKPRDAYFEAGRRLILEQMADGSYTPLSLWIWAESTTGSQSSLSHMFFVDNELLLGIGKPGRGVLEVSYDASGTLHGVDVKVDKSRPLDTRDTRIEDDHIGIRIDNRVRPTEYLWKGNDGTRWYFLTKEGDKDLIFRRELEDGRVTDEGRIPLRQDIARITEELVRPETLENPFSGATRSDESWARAHIPEISGIEWRVKSLVSK